MPSRIENFEYEVIRSKITVLPEKPYQLITGRRFDNDYLDETSDNAFALEDWTSFNSYSGNYGDFAVAFDRITTRTDNLFNGYYSDANHRTITGTLENPVKFLKEYKSVSLIDGHKYMMCYRTAKRHANYDCSVSITNGSDSEVAIVETPLLEASGVAVGSWTNPYAFFTYDAETCPNPVFNVNFYDVRSIGSGVSNANYSFKDFCLFDLTATYGAGNEPSSYAAFNADYHVENAYFEYNPVPTEVE